MERFTTGCEIKGLKRKNPESEARLMSSRNRNQMSRRKSMAPLARWKIETRTGTGRLRGLRLYQTGRFFFAVRSGMESNPSATLGLIWNLDGSQDYSRLRIAPVLRKSAKPDIFGPSPGSPPCPTSPFASQ